jgi:hypothetical protein
MEEGVAMDSVPDVVMLPKSSDVERVKDRDVMCCWGVGTDGCGLAGCGVDMQSVGGTGRRYGSKSFGGRNALRGGECGSAISRENGSGGPGGISFAHAAMP